MPKIIKSEDRRVMIGIKQSYFIEAGKAGAPDIEAYIEYLKACILTLKIEAKIDDKEIQKILEASTPQP